jgi:hypothetical protein
MLIVNITPEINIFNNQLNNNLIVYNLKNNPNFVEADSVKMTEFTFKFFYVDIITPLKNKLKNQLAYRTFGCLKKLATF